MTSPGRDLGLSVQTWREEAARRYLASARRRQGRRRGRLERALRALAQAGGTYRTR